MENPRVIEHVQATNGTKLYASLGLDLIKSCVLIYKPVTYAIVSTSSFEREQNDLFPGDPSAHLPMTNRQMDEIFFSLPAIL